MKKQILIFGMLGILLLSGIIPVTATHPFKRTVDISDQGIFEAELGRRGSDEPFVTLEGQYRVHDRFVTFGGSVTTENREGRFRGAFQGNHFIIQIPAMQKTFTIFGRFNMNDDNTFRGLWIARGVHARGWITGILTPSD